MSTLTAAAPETAPVAVAAPTPITRRRSRLRRLFTPGRILLHIVTVVFMLVWFTPVLGLFVSAVRTQADSATSGWWTALIDPLFTGYNYQQAMGFISAGESLATSLAISIPTTVLTTVLSLIGAYALTRMTFAGRTLISLLLVAMLVIPPQVTLVPMLKFFAAIGLQGSIPSVWIYQVGFTIPFGIFLIRGFIASIPEELFEAAAIDGASTFQTFRTIVTPLSLPVLASLAIMQFLWSWNDLLIPLLFLGGSDLEAPLTVQVAGLVQSNGEGEAVLMAATCLSILVPLVILIGMQRFFVRGVLGGAVKGMITPDVLIVGSGLMGAATARLIRESGSDARIVMVDGGAVIGARPGQHLHDSPEPAIHERYNARVASGVQALYTGAAVSPPVDGHLADVEPGMYHLSALGENAEALPGGSLAWNVGGMGVHWTAACPTPWGREVPDFLPRAEWDKDVATARRVLGVHDDAFGITAAGRAVLRELDAVFGPASADGRHPRTMPMAMTPTATGTRPRTGPNRILPAMTDGSDPAFTLLPGTLCVRLEHHDGSVVAAIVRDVATGVESRIEAGIVLVCADTLRTPQLLFASGIRPAALGTHLNEHAFLTGRVFPDVGRLGIDPNTLAAPRDGEWAVGAYWLPHSDEAQPFHGQMMERPHLDDAGSTVDYSVGLALYVPTEVRAENRLEFSDDESDAMGMPRMRVHFDYSAHDRELIELARRRQREAAERIGRFDPERDSALLSPGSSLHFTGTVRMGPIDDGTSVCDPDARVWGFDNLYLAGNGVVPTPVTANSTLTGMTFAVRTARAVVAALTARGISARPTATDAPAGRLLEESLR